MGNFRERLRQQAHGFTPLERPRAESRGKIKDSYTFSHWVNAPCESLLTGFTLLEVMIAMTVLSFALLSLVAMAATVIRGNAFSKKLATATALAQDEAERIKGLNYRSIPGRAGTEDYGAITGYPGFSRAVTVNTDSLNYFRTVTVTVRWNDARPHSVAVITIIHDPNP